MRDRLRAVVAAVQPKVHQLQVRAIPREDSPLLEVSAALVRTAWQQSHSILALADAQSWGGIGAVERATWEVWNELDFLLRSEDPTLAAAKVQSNAVLDVLDALEKTENPPAGMLERNREFRDSLETLYPAAFAEVQEQRTGKRKQFHWSGRSRTAVAGPDDASRQVYKILSWDTHPDIASLRGVEVVFDEAVTRVKFADEDTSEAIERSCRSAAELLLRSWNLFAEFWSLDKLTGLAGWHEDA